MEKGLWAEQMVNQFLLQDQWQMVQRRWNSPWGEVDGVYKRAQTILLIEVKYVQGSWWVDPVAKGQKKRLLKIFHEMVERFHQYEVLLWLMVVTPDGSIQVLTDYFGE